MVEPAFTRLRLGPGRMVFCDPTTNVYLADDVRQFVDIPYGLPLRGLLPALRSKGIIEMSGLIDIEKGEWKPLAPQPVEVVSASADSPSVVEGEKTQDAPVEEKPAKHKKTK